MTRPRKPKPVPEPRPIRAWAACVGGVPVPTLIRTRRSATILAYEKWAGEPWKKRSTAWRCLPVLISPVVKTKPKPKDGSESTKA